MLPRVPCFSLSLPIGLLALLFLGLSGLFAAPAPVAAPAPTAVAADDDSLAASMKSQGYTALPLKRGTGAHLEIIAEINGVSGQFLVDTGAQISVVNRPSLARFKLTAVKTGVRVFGAVGGPGETISAAFARLQIGPCSTSPFLLGVSDLTALNQGRRKGVESRFDGILGADVLQNFGFIIDFNESRLYGKQAEAVNAGQVPTLDTPKRKPAEEAGLGQIPPPVAPRLAPFLKARGYSEIPMQRRSISDFEVVANVNGRRALWLVDTGAAITLLDSVLSRRAGIKLNKTNLSVGGAGGGRQRIDIGVVDNLRLASLRVRSAVIAISDISANNAALQVEGKPPIDGYLGADFLREKSAVVDCAQMKLFLKN